MPQANQPPVELLNGYRRVDTLPILDPVPGIHMRPISSARMTLNFVSFDVAAVAPVHTHPQDQMGIVLEGQMEFEINGQRRTVGTGEVYSVPGNVPHGARAVGDRACVALDIFAPRRDDFMAVARGLGA